MQETSEELPNFSIGIDFLGPDPTSSKNEAEKNLQVAQPIGTFVYFFVRYENFSLYHNKENFFAQILDVALLQNNFFMPLAVRISSYGCTREVWRALKKLELHSAIASCNSYASFVLSKPPACTITRYTHAKHKQILKYTRTAVIEIKLALIIAVNGN